MCVCVCVCEGGGVGRGEGEGLGDFIIWYSMFACQMCMYRYKYIMQMRTIISLIFFFVLQLEIQVRYQLK